MKKTFRKILFAGCAATALFLFAVLAVNFHIAKESGPYLFSKSDELPETEAALVLGAKVYRGGAMSPMFEDRASAAFELYKKGKTKKILVSGDHGKENYDEVNAAGEYLKAKGVKGEDIFLDHAGFDTYDSLYRAKKIFKVSSLVIVTQNFHLPRAVYIGRNLGMETYGFGADKHSYPEVKYNKLREILSNIKAFLDVSFHAKPKFLGEEIPISGDSRKSWDKKSFNTKEVNKISEDKGGNLKESTKKRASYLLPGDEKEKDVFKERDVLFKVPFMSQAPFGNWSDPRKQDGCEEAAAIMAMAWVRGIDKLTVQKVDKEINAISSYEEKTYGNFHDTSAKDTAERIFKGYYGYDRVQTRHDITKEDIKNELFKGNLVIVPTNGRKLGNLNYTPPGPSTHNLVIIGYDVETKEFITNDPGTRKGKNYRYNEGVLEGALLDYPTGNHKKVKEEKTAMIIVSK